MGYDLNSLNANPLLEHTFRLKYNSPAKNTGTTGLTSTDYFDNAVIGTLTTIYYLVSDEGDILLSDEGDILTTEVTQSLRDLGAHEIQ